jgi:hypothetical protein
VTRFPTILLALCSALAAPPALSGTLSLLPDEARHITLPFEVGSGFITLIPLRAQP